MICLEVPPHRVIRIDPEQVDAVMDRVAPLLSRSVGYTAGHVSVHGMIKQLRQGWRDWMLWVVERDRQLVGAFIITMEACGQDRVATFEILAGTEAQAWIGGLFAPFEQYLSEMWRVTQVRVVGRRGWERFLSRHGFEPSHFITSKRVCNSPALPTSTARLS